MILGKVFTYRSLELITVDNCVNGRYPDVRIENSVILICHMFWAKMPTQARGTFFLPGFQKFSYSEVRCMFAPPQCSSVSL